MAMNARADDAQEGMCAFLQKRPPEWRGTSVEAAPQAARSGDLAAVRDDCWPPGADPNAREDDNAYPMHWAAAAGHLADRHGAGRARRRPRCDGGDPSAATRSRSLALHEWEHRGAGPVRCTCRRSAAATRPRSSGCSTDARSTGGASGTPGTTATPPAAPVHVGQQRGRECCSGGGRGRRPIRHCYGCVVDRVNVSVLLYVPVRSASFALTRWLNPSVRASLEIGAGPGQQVQRVGRRADVVVRRARVGRVTCPGLQRLRQEERAVDQVAGVVELGSATLSSASPAVEITLAVVEVS